jgi:uncharacterized protein
MPRRIVLAVVALAVALVVAPGAQAASTDLFFSECIEGSSNNKALEIHNGTGAPIDLATGGYNVQMFFNGSATAGLTIDLTGTVADGDVFVLSHAGATGAILAFADQTNGAGWFNGDDAVVLRRGTTILDVIGQIGFDPGTEWGTGLTSTADNTLRRKAAITAGDPNGSDAFDPAAEWDGFATDTFGGLGYVGPQPPPVAARIYEIQGAGHVSPLNGGFVSGVPGVVTAVRPNSFTMQDAVGDGIDATSDAILVFGVGTPTVAVGQAVSVGGRVAEFRPGGPTTTNLTTTEIVSPTVAPAGPGVAIAETLVGASGRVPPTSVIDDDATGSVETSGSFDAATDGIDFYESLEAMLLRVDDPIVVGPTNQFGELWVLADNGAGAGIRTVRQGIVIGAGDFNPERIQLEDDIVTDATPDANVGDHFTSAAVGVLDYNFGNYELQLTRALTRVDGELQREATAAQGPAELAVATFNVENLSPADPAAKFARIADLIVDNLQAPDILALEEIQDNDGPANTAVTDASVTLQQLIAAIQAAGGPTYEFRQINPVDDADGGQPGGNIRVGFLFRTDRGLEFVDRPGGASTTATGVTGRSNHTRLTFSPGRIDPQNAAWADSRKPLAGEFRYRGKTYFVIVNHFSSKGGDQPLFGRFQPPARTTEVQRHRQAQVVNDFVDQILVADRNALVVVLGDINDFEFSETVDILEGDGVLTSLMDMLPKAERYSYVFEGNSQVLDQVLVSEKLAKPTTSYDVVHVNAEFFDQASDHDPQVARFVFDDEDD